MTDQQAAPIDRYTAGIEREPVRYFVEFRIGPSPWASTRYMPIEAACALACALQSRDITARVIREQRLIEIIGG